VGEKVDFGEKSKLHHLLQCWKKQKNSAKAVMTENQPEKHVVSSLPMR
jgi:hypothetical protein